MEIGAVLPHLGMYGGVRRFLELGNVFVKRGIDYTLFSRKRQKCSWFECNFPIKDWSNIEGDCILIGDPPSFSVIPRVKGKIFIYVLAAGGYTSMYKEVYGKYPFIAINRTSLEFFPNAYLTEVGVNTSWFTPKKRKVLFYNDKRPIKNALYIKRQLSGIDSIELIGLRGLNNEQIRDAYQNGDYFVAWETRGGGTCNTAVEALASGLTVVTNGVNTDPYSDRVIKVKNLRKFFTDPMGEFSWEGIADKWLKIFRKEMDIDRAKLFLAPHNDDEALFAAYTIMREKPLVVIVTDSWVQYLRGEKTTAEQRRKESQMAMESLGAPTEFLGIKDNELTDEVLIEKLRQYQPTKVYAPLPNSKNPQHNLVGQAAQILWPDEVVFYSTYTRESLSPTGEIEIKPNQEEIELKNKALDCYKSQIGIMGPHFSAVRNKSEYLNRL